MELLMEINLILSKSYRVEVLNGGLKEAIRYMILHI